MVDDGISIPVHETEESYEYVDGEVVGGSWRQVEVPGLGSRWAYVAHEDRAWDLDLIGSLALYAAQWLQQRTSSEGTRATYLADIGLPHLLARLGDDGHLIAEDVRARTGVTLPVRTPGPRNVAWHLSLLPWLAGQRVDPWGPRVCEIMPAWGDQLTGHGDVADHVWATDAIRTRALSTAMQRRRAASVRSYYRWHHARGLTVCSPADIWTPKAAGIPAQSAFRDTGDELDREDLARLQIAADTHDGVDGDQALASAVVAVLVGTAIRSVEVSRLDLSDYLRGYRRGPLLRIHGKGNRERLVSLDQATVDRLDRWIMWRPDLAQSGPTVAARLATASRLPHRTPLFTPLRGSRSALAAARRAQEGHAGRLGEKSVWTLLRRVAGASTDRLVRMLAATIHPHGIRSAVATDLL